MPEQLPEKTSPKKWEEMTLEEKVEDLNQRMYGSKNWPYRISLIVAATVVMMLFMSVAALLFSWPVMWLTGDTVKTWSEAIPGLVAGMIGAGVGMLVFVWLFRPSLRREWEASYTAKYSK